MRTGCYPGSFNPLTVAHLALAEAARDLCGLDRVDLVVSRVALGKEPVDPPELDRRIAVLRRVTASRPWLAVVVSDRQLLADLAAGYDVLLVGADKWAQAMDPAFYGGSVAARDAALARLPPLAVAGRPGHDVELPAGATRICLPKEVASASSTAVRAGRTEWSAAPAER